jgi:glucosamine 6-phosphate synthetase-like amidotransferase/phosphosugar isomerase protein
VTAALLEVPSRAAEVLDATTRSGAGAPRRTGARRVVSRPQQLLPDRPGRRVKLKEISYIHAEGYAAGEMKHGHCADRQGRQ